MSNLIQVTRLRSVGVLLAAFVTTGIACDPSDEPLPPSSSDTSPAASEAGATADPEAGRAPNAGRGHLVGAVPDAGSPADAIAPPAPEPLVFAVRGPTSTEIYLGQTDGSPPHALTNTTNAIEAFPRFSPDHSRIAFIRDGSLFVMNADGSDARDLGVIVSPPSPPAWSPDGTSLVYVHQPPPCYHEDTYGNTCVTELRHVTLSGVDSLFRSYPILLEPIWLPSGEVVSFRACSGEGCGSDQAFLSGSLAGDFFGLPDGYVHGHGVAVDRTMIRMAISVSDPSTLFDYSQPGPIYVYVSRSCQVRETATDARFPRWSPRGGADLAYVRDDGIWIASEGPAAVSRHVYALTGVTGLDW